MFVREPQQYLYGAIFFPALFFILHFIIRKFFLHKEVPLSKHVITESDAWDIAAKIVTIAYSVLSTLCGYLIITGTEHDIYHGQHWMTNGWARFGLAYYYYDTLVKVEGIALDKGKGSGDSTVAKWVALIKKDTLMFIHHIFLPLIFYPVILYFRHDACDFFVATFYASDFPVPFIQLRHILARLNLKHVIFYPINGIFMTIAFAICRVLIFPYLYSLVGKRHGLRIWEVPAFLPKKCTIGCSVLIVIQLYWLYVMVRGIFAFFSRKEGHEKLS